ncbi:Putative D-isomer specific 2-hydroxyacid dehydrogenase, catalytic domain-containing protein [Colletotrichum destructivum]|uniref:D-isomer specific 2-hydroxyacid dehydrogenase, catalytic domain-containing protein n=1 Tax=Colletotrichum destructivum TaxID=34406 RepID=A0AAX4I5C8_9PEZI|nr:Putative D-isomer specific 2-hydroxyacid dehydrogenase, catalytic domain-containing protein [Colletotrichum destructivum]
MADPATEVKKPARLPSPTHHVVVKLETIHVPLPDVDTGTLTHEVIGYEYTRPSQPGVAAARAWPASVLITTTVPINAETLGDAPYLKCVITDSTGTDHVDLDECRRRGITVMYSPNATVEAVSEHALALYFSTRRRLVTLHNTMMDHDDTRPNPWRAKGSMSSLLLDAEGRPPHTCGNEVVGVIGYGPIGQRVAKLCRALGMEVLVAARKDAEPSPPPITSASATQSKSDPRTPFAEVLRRATVLFLVVPLTPDTRNLVAARELETLRPDAVLVNVGRGGTVDEAALLSALREGRIAGAATDVFEVEPAGSAADSVLLGEGARGVNLTLTPHLAWCADQTRVNIRRVVGENVRAFVRGEKEGNFVLDMR